MLLLPCVPSITGFQEKKEKSRHLWGSGILYTKHINNIPRTKTFFPRPTDAFSPLAPDNAALECEIWPDSAVTWDTTRLS